jgi:hypothetical protein
LNVLDNSRADAIDKHPPGRPSLSTKEDDVCIQIPYQRGTTHCEDWHCPKTQHFAAYCAKQRPRPSRLHKSVFTVCTAHCAPKCFTDDTFDTLHRSQRAASAVHCYRGQTWDNHATTTHSVTSQEIRSKSISKQHHSDCLWDHKYASSGFPGRWRHCVNAEHYCSALDGLR